MDDFLKKLRKIKFSEKPLMINPNFTDLKLSLVIPTFNERSNIEDLLRRLVSVLNKFCPDQYELIIVDDNSPDKTWELAERLKILFPSLRVVRRINEYGLATAVIRGWQISKGKFIGVIDADLQHPPELLPDLMEKLENGAELAIASRYTKGGFIKSWNWFRFFLSQTAKLICLLILPEVGLRVSDPMSGYFIINRQAISEIPMNPIGYKILIEIISKSQIKYIEEVGYFFQNRTKETSNASYIQSIEYILHLLKLRWEHSTFVSRQNSD